MSGSSQLHSDHHENASDG